MRARTLLLLAAAVLLAACGKTVQITRPDGTQVVLSESVYAHELSVNAFVAASDDRDACYKKASTELGLMICRGGAGAGASVQVPTYQAPPTAFDRGLQAVSVVTPLAMGFLQYRQADQANERAYLSGIRLAEIGADREARIVESVAGLGIAGQQATAGVAIAGQQSTASLAGAGFLALERLGTATATAGADSTRAVADAIAALPPTTAITAGGDIAIAGRDQTGGHHVEGSGNETDTVTNTDCQALASAAPASAQGSVSGSAAASGTTGAPSAGSNPSGSVGATSGPATATTNCQPRG